MKQTTSKHARSVSWGNRSVSWGNRAVATVLVVALLLPTLMIAPTTILQAKAQPALLSLATEQPQASVRIIARLNGDLADAAALVESLGGTFLHDLSLINAFAAELSAAGAKKLAQNPAVSWVTLDSPVLRSASTATSTVRDEFNAVAYDNNDGTATWLTSWSESNDNGTPAYGDVLVAAGMMQLKRAGHSVERSADLTGAASAILSFDIQTGWGMEPGSDVAVVEISVDGGFSYTVLESFSGYAGGDVDARSYDISDYITADTRVRIRIANEYFGFGEWFAVDNVQIEFGTPTPGLETFTLRDEFNAVGYENNDGTATWTSNWTESEFDGNPFFGRVQATYGMLHMRDAVNSAWRKADLSTAASATLGFDYFLGSGIDPGDVAIVEISSDGGLNYVALETFSGLTGASSGAREFDITPYVSSDTTVRFAVIDRFGGQDEWFAVDNVQIEYVVPPCAECVANTFLDTINVEPVWDMGYTGQGIGIAIIDSGVAQDADFQNISTSIAFGNGDTADVFGHGTHVAGIAAGNGTDSGGLYKGVAPDASIINVAISDGYGVSYESDAVAALQWVFENKDLYNIRVVNMSINTAAEQSYHESPMDAAAEILWFNGVVVVVSVGNKGTSTDANTAKAAPANDPFLIVTGASHEQETADRSDDLVASFSDYATTLDGYKKPDIIAPGKNIMSVASANSQWAATFPDRTALNGEYFRLSGTSMSAPMVSGAVALMLQADPTLTPDQVKYRLLNSGSSIGDLRVSYPYLDVYAAVTSTAIESANTGQQASSLLTTGSEPVTSSVSWNSVSWNSVSWNSVSWNSVSWNSVSWNSVSWNSVSWNN